MQVHSGTKNQLLQSRRNFEGILKDIKTGAKGGGQQVEWLGNTLNLLSCQNLSCS